MPSLQSRLLIFALQNRHLLRLQFKKQRVFDWDTSIEAFRANAEEGSKRLGKMPAGIRVHPLNIGSIYAEWISPENAPSDKVLLYFHGGGYVSGGCSTHRAHVAKFSAGSGIRALLFDYRLAPENPYPAALEDALAAYSFLLAEGIQASNIVFGGDSAGGGLALGTLMALRDKGIPLPAAIFALSPWTDLKCTGDSISTRVKIDPFTPIGSWTVFSSYYAGDHDLCHPWISPLYGDFEGMPPMLVYAGDRDVLFDDSTRLVAKAKAAGVDATLRVGEGLFHCYPVCAGMFPEATEAMQEICQFIRQRLK